MSLRTDKHAAAQPRLVGPLPLFRVFTVLRVTIISPAGSKRGLVQDDSLQPGLIQVADGFQQRTGLGSAV